MKAFADDPIQPGRFGGTVVFAAVLSCVLVSFALTLAILLVEPSWRHAGPLAVVILVLTSSFSALMLGFVGACLFLAPAMLLSCRRWPGARGLVIGGAWAGFFNAVCGWTFGWVGMAVPHWQSPAVEIVGILAWLGGFYLAGGGLPEVFKPGSWDTLAVLVVVQSAAGALAGWWAGLRLTR